MITINKISYFANFEQVKKCWLLLLTFGWVVILLTLNIICIIYAILINFYLYFFVLTSSIYHNLLKTLRFIHMLNQDKLDYSLLIFSSCHAWQFKSSFIYSVIKIYCTVNKVNKVLSSKLGYHFSHEAHCCPFSSL